MEIIKYNNGIDFYNDNLEILNTHLIETAFFKLNYPFINTFEKENYAIKIKDKDKYLIALQRTPYNLLIFGNHLLTKNLVEIIKKEDLKVNGILTNKLISNEFLKEASSSFDGFFTLRNDMSILTCNKFNQLNHSYEILNPTELDLNELKELHELFHEEIYHEKATFEIDDILPDLNNYQIIKLDNKIVSMVKKVRDELTICSISYVYTRINYRSKGLARVLVTNLTNEIVSNNKTAYLFVDNLNPISNHLYTSIGYCLKEERIEYIYNKK